MYHCDFSGCEFKVTEGPFLEFHQLLAHTKFKDEAMMNWVLRILCTLSQSDKVDESFSVRLGDVMKLSAESPEKTDEKPRGASVIRLDPKQVINIGILLLDYSLFVGAMSRNADHYLQWPKSDFDTQCPVAGWEHQPGNRTGILLE